MGLSDCIECWMTPCECGYEYRNWSIEAKIKQIKAIMGKDKKEILEKLNQHKEDGETNDPKESLKDPLKDKILQLRWKDKPKQR